MYIKLNTSIVLTSEELAEITVQFEKEGNLSSPSVASFKPNFKNGQIYKKDDKISGFYSAIDTDTVSWSSVYERDNPLASGSQIINRGLTFVGEKTVDGGFIVEEIHCGNCSIGFDAKSAQQRHHPYYEVNDLKFLSDDHNYNEVNYFEDIVPKKLQAKIKTQLGLDYIVENGEFYHIVSVHARQDDAFETWQVEYADLPLSQRPKGVDGIAMRQLNNFHMHAFQEYAQDYPSENPQEWGKSLGFTSRAAVKQLILSAQDLSGAANAGVMAQVYPDGNVLVGFTPIAESIKDNPEFTKQLIADMLKKLRSDLEASGQKIGGIFMERPVKDDPTSVMKREIVELAGYQWVEMKDGSKYQHREPIWDADESEAAQTDYHGTKTPILLAASWIGTNGQTFQQAVVSMTENYYNKDGHYGHGFAADRDQECDSVQQDKGLALAREQAKGIKPLAAAKPNACPALQRRVEPV